MAKFSMNDLLNEKSREEIKSVFKIKNLAIEEIEPDERNFYNTDEIEELKASIEMFGLQQNLVVRESDSKYKIISGHRRLKALKELFSEGHEEFRTIPCKIESEIDDAKTELQLIFANSTSRELSDYEKTHQAIRIKELLKDLKTNGVKIPGKMRNLVAEVLNISPTQIGRMESIDKNLSEEFKEEFKNDNVNISIAYEISGLPEQDQKKVYDEYKENGQISLKDVKKHKEDIKRLEKATSTEKLDEGEALKVYVCTTSSSDKTVAAKCVEQVINSGHIPFNSSLMMQGIGGLQVEKAIRAINYELINLSDEIWVFGKDSEEDSVSSVIAEVNIAQNLNKPIVYKDV